MNQLILLRHGESVWNNENLFTGWTDVGLSQTGHAEAIQAGRLLKAEGFRFDLCYTSYLKRAIHTANHVLEELSEDWIPMIKTWKLNERHYGALQGLNKSETARKYGEEQVQIWRRSFGVRPPKLEPEDPRNPALQETYRGIAPGKLPLTESLEDTVARVIPYFEAEIRPQLLAGKRILIAAHGNSLRALVMYLERLSEQQIVTRNIPTGIPLVYELDNQLEVTGSRYLGDAETVAQRTQAVQNQGKQR